MNIDYEDESIEYSPEQINDFLMSAVKMGDPYHVRKILQYFAHIWIQGDYCSNVDMNPVVESFINIDKSCFTEFSYYFSDINEWEFNSSESFYFKKLNFFDIAVENGLTEDILNMAKEGEKINTKSMTILFRNHHAQYIRNLLEEYKKETNNEIRPNKILFPNLLREQITNLLQGKEKTYQNKKELVEEWKNEFAKAYDLKILSEDFLCNDYLNYKFFDELAHEEKESVKRIFRQGVKDFTGIDYKEILKSSPPRIFESRSSLNTMERILSKEELKEVISDYFISLPSKNNFFYHRVADSLIYLLDNGFNKILKKHELQDFVFGENGFLPERYSNSKKIEDDKKDGFFKTCMESLILKKEIIGSPKDDLKIRKRI